MRRIQVSDHARFNVKRFNGRVLLGQTNAIEKETDNARTEEAAKPIAFNSDIPINLGARFIRDRSRRSPRRRSIPRVTSVEMRASAFRSILHSRLEAWKPFGKGSGNLFFSWIRASTRLEENTFASFGITHLRAPAVSPVSVASSFPSSALPSTLSPISTFFLSTQCSCCRIIRPFIELFFIAERRMANRPRHERTALHLDPRFFFSFDERTVEFEGSSLRVTPYSCLDA